MALKSKRKGRAFEQLIADAYRQKWPYVIVRRSLQAHKAFEPDVVIDGHELASRLWTECQHADCPTPEAKLLQSERDVGDKADRYPIVVWRRTKSPHIYLTTRLWVLQELSGTSIGTWASLVATVEFYSWLFRLPE